MNIYARISRRSHPHIYPPDSRQPDFRPSPEINPPETPSEQEEDEKNK